MGRLERRVLGRTGLEVTVMGLGCGGYSKLGLGYGNGDETAEAVVRHALDRGVNVIDTAEWYGTEKHIGRAIEGFRRDSFVLCSKAGVRNDGGLRDAAGFRTSIENSLRHLGTDYIDVYAVHGLRLDDYDATVEIIVPELRRQKEKGSIRFFGVTEAFGSDTLHAMLKKAVDDDVWDTMMVGFNVINQSARDRVFVPSSENGAGILGMFAVRNALTGPGTLKPVLQRLLETGEILAHEIDMDNPLGFALDETSSGTLSEVAYRFAIQEQRIHTVLSGTGSLTHLDENIDAAIQGPLSEQAFGKLKKIFAGVRSESGKSPSSPW